MLPSYARAMRCPVLTYSAWYQLPLRALVQRVRLPSYGPMVLPMRSPRMVLLRGGGGGGVSAGRVVCRGEFGAGTSGSMLRPILLCHSYAVSGTDVGQSAMRCPVLTQTLLCDLRYCHRPRYAMSGTEIGYAATRPCACWNRWMIRSGIAPPSTLLRPCWAMSGTQLRRRYLMEDFHAERFGADWHDGLRSDPRP
eukprot:3922627-Rhodomonas_salina.1